MSAPTAPNAPSTASRHFTLVTHDRDGRILELDTVGADVLIVARFRTRSAPLLGIGDRTPCAIQGGNLKLPVQLEGYTVYRADDAEHRTYHFLFRDQAQRSLGMLVNQRLSIRVRPTGNAPIQARIELRGEQTEVAVNDISSTGISLLVGPELEAALCNMRLLPLHLKLPDVEQELRFLGFIRNRRLLGSAIAYGVQFDQVASQSFPRSQELVVQYVMQRHVEDLRERLRQTDDPD